MIEMFLLMLAGHALADFALQSEFMANGKNRHIVVIREKNAWAVIMAAHCMIHAGIVLLITASPLIAILEFIAHYTIDTIKCDGKINFMRDQALHIGCKIIWIGLYALIGA